MVLRGGVGRRKGRESVCSHLPALGSANNMRAQRASQVSSRMLTWQPGLQWEVGDEKPP